MCMHACMCPCARARVLRPCMHARDLHACEHAAAHCPLPPSLHACRTEGARRPAAGPVAPAPPLAGGMRVKAINRDAEEETKERSQDIKKVQRSYDLNLHQFERAHEYTRALNAAKLERIFAKVGRWGLGRGAEAEEGLALPGSWKAGAAAGRWAGKWRRLQLRRGHEGCGPQQHNEAVHNEAVLDVRHVGSV